MRGILFVFVFLVLSSTSRGENQAQPQGGVEGEGVNTKQPPAEYDEDEFEGIKDLPIDQEVIVDDDSDPFGLEEDDEGEGGGGDGDEYNLDDFDDAFAVTSSKYVDVKYVMPFVEKRNDIDTLVIGEYTTVVLGFLNNGEEPLNITSVQAFLHSAYSFDFYLQNFTVRECNRIIGPSDHASIEYRFRCDPNLEPMEYQLSADVMYRTAEEEMDFIEYRTKFMNVTIDYIDGPSPISNIAWVIYAGFLSLGVYFALPYLKSLEFFESQNKGGTATKKSTETEEDTLTPQQRKEKNEASWLTGLGNDPKKSSKKGKGGKSNKKGKKKKKS